MTSFALTAEVRAEAERRLDAIERDHGVRILMAVESGSRAWGFPSPDSDYDVRFLYVRPARGYLKLDPPRDVIETPIEGLWDVNGWDLGKALRLLRKGNAVVVEWLRSPLVYRETGSIPDRMRILTERFSNPADAARHYYPLLHAHYGRDIAKAGDIKLKRYFYSIRAAAALTWLRERGTVPPMDLPSLVAGGVISDETRAVLDPMIATKARTVELGFAPRIPVLDAYIEQALAWGAQACAAREAARDPVFEAAADRLFLQAIGLDGPA